MVYGICGLLPKSFGIVPDYTKTPEGVFEEATRCIVDATGSLDIILQACSGRHALPSWVPNFREREDTLPRYILHKELWLPYGLSRCSFARKEPPRTTTRCPASILQVRGCLLDTVTAITATHLGYGFDYDYKVPLPLYYEWRTMYEQSTLPCSTGTPDKHCSAIGFWRTVCGGTHGLVSQLFRSETAAVLESLVGMSLER